SGVFELAWTLVRSPEFNSDLADINLAFLALQLEFNREDATVGQALILVNDKRVLDMARASADKLLKATNGKSDRSLVDVLFLLSFCRFASEKELDQLEKHMKQQKDRQSSVGDVIWVLINTKEFLSQARGMVVDSKLKGMKPQFVEKFQR